MPNFLFDLKNGLENCQISTESTLVAVSGGADSVALVRGLKDLQNGTENRLVIAHFNHQLRGRESDLDAEWVTQLAESIGLPIEIGRASDSALNPSGTGLEERARTARYEFLASAARRHQCQSIALAHTADDQAETVLHHLIRGTGMAGLRGMLPTRSMENDLRIVRPMLQIRRSQLLEYLESLGQDYRTDSSNLDTSLTRNRIRHVLLPLVRNEFNPQVDHALLRLAEQASEVETCLNTLAAQLLTRCIRDEQLDACRIDVSELLDSPRALNCELFRLVWQRQKWPQQGMGHDHWCRLDELLRTRKAQNFPGQIEARFSSERLLVLRRCPNLTEK